MLLSFNDGSPAGLLEFMKPADRKIFYTEYKKYISIETNDYIYLEPTLKGLVKYRNLTKKGFLRIPSSKIGLYKSADSIQRSFTVIPALFLNKLL